MSSTSVHSTATMRYWKKKKTNATYGIDEKELVQVALLQIHGGDGAYVVGASRKSDRSFIGSRCAESEITVTRNRRSIRDTLRPSFLHLCRLQS